MSMTQPQQPQKQQPQGNRNQQQQQQQPQQPHQKQQQQQPQQQPRAFMPQEPFYGVPRGVAQCQQERTEELSRRMRDRNVPSAPLQPQMCARPVMTKYAIMPILDQRKEATVPLSTYPAYNPEHVFNPGSAVAPWSGYATAVNVESTLRNQFFGLQRCEQSEYVPSSKSDLYNVRIDSRQIPQTHPLLFRTEKFAPVNPDCFNLANRTFNNSTRTEIKNVE